MIINRIKSFLSKSFEEGTEINKINALVVTVIGASAHFIFYFVFKYVFDLPYENIYIRMIAVLLCLPVFTLYKYQTRLTVKLYWHLTLIFVMPFIFTVNLLKTNFHDVWLWWEIFMVFVLVMYVQNWFMVLVDMLLGVGFAVLFYLLTPQSSVPLNPQADLYLYFTVLIYTIITGLVFAYTNIQGRTIQQQLRRKIAQKKSKIFKSLAGSIAHELRNPLNSIRLSVSLLNDQITKKSKTQLLNLDKEEIINMLQQEQDEIIKHKEILDQTVKLANEIIDMTLLDLSGKSLSKKDLIHLRSKKAITDTMNIYGYQSDEERKRVIFKNLDQNFIFNAVEAPLKYILFNLVKNALFYIKEYPNSLITIGTETNKIHKINGSKQIYNEIYVHDNGPGIPKDSLKKIFGSFYSSGKEGGTGLGLDFCKRTMISFGGDIIVESKFGSEKAAGWTKFSLLFPTISYADNVEEQNSVSAKILLVDDQEINLITTKRRIRNDLPNIICDSVLGGRQALKAIKSSKYDLILLDIEMPEMGGVETAKRIRLIDKKIPIIAFTSLNHGEFLKQFQGELETKNSSDNFNDYLNKSMPSHILCRAITKWIVIDDNFPYLGEKDHYVSALKGKNIILADDQEINLMTTKRKLERAGLQVKTVKNGVELIEIYNESLSKYGKSAYDLIITDINMPQLNGDAAAMQIRKIEKDQNISHENAIPIIALSGDGQKEDILQFLNSEMTDYFTKGNDPELLIKIVANYLI